MKLVSPTAHGWLDYLMVAVLAVAPGVLGLSGATVIAGLVLAAVHLALTLATDFPPGFGPLVPMYVHGGIEVFVGIVLTIGGVVGGLLLGLLDGGDTAFLVIIGIMILAIWGLTDYGAVRPAARRPRGP